MGWTPDDAEVGGGAPDDANTPACVVGAPDDADVVAGAGCCGCAPDDADETPGAPDDAAKKGDAPKGANWLGTPDDVDVGGWNVDVGATPNKLPHTPVPEDVGACPICGCGGDAGASLDVAMSFPERSWASNAEICNWSWKICC